MENGDESKETRRNEVRRRNSEGTLGCGRDPTENQRLGLEGIEEEQENNSNQKRLETTEQGAFFSQIEKQDNGLDPVEIGHGPNHKLMLQTFFSYRETKDEGGENLQRKKK